MARFSVSNLLSPALTVLGIGTSFSNVVKVESIRDLRLFLFISALGGASTLDTVIQISPDGTTWTDSGTFNQITTVNNFVKVLEEKEISTYIRLKYVVAVDTVTLKAVVEGKQGQ